MSVFEKVSNVNFLPKIDNGRFYVFSAQFNKIVEKLNTVFPSSISTIVADLTGNVTGDLTGDVTGDLTGGVNLTVVAVADLGDAANAVNTAGKVVGKIVVGDDGLIYSAAGTGDTDDWKASDGSSDITPS